MLFAPTLAIENLPGVRILMSKLHHFPCTAGTLEKLLPRTLAQLSPTLPRICVCGGGGGRGGGAVVTNDWCIILGLFDQLKVEVGGKTSIPWFSFVSVCTVVPSGFKSRTSLSVYHHELTVQ